MSIEIGKVVTGKVTGITHFGAFIDLGDRKTGLVHISEISDSYIKDINDVLTVGDEVEVRVLTIADDGKIGLSIRKAQENATEDSQPQRQHKPAPRSTTAYKPREDRPSSYNKGRDSRERAPQSKEPKKDSFDNLMSSFLKDSDDRLTSLKRNTEGKRGGRGGRRN